MEEENKKGQKGFKIFIIIFIIASMFLFKKENQEKLIGIMSSISNKEETLILIDSFPKGDLEDLNIYDDTIVKWTKNKLSFLNIDGIKIVDKEFDFLDPDIFFGENIIYPMDKATGDIYYLNKKGETIDRLETNKAIFNFEEIDQNIIYHEKSQNVEDINILDSEKIQIGHYIYEDESILSYSTNKEGTKNIIALMDINQGRIKSRIDCYGENNEKLYEIEIDGQIIVYLGFTPKDEIVVLTDSCIYFIKNEEVVWEKDLNLIKDIYLDKEAIHILYSNYLEVIGFDGNTKNKIGFTEEYKKIIAFKNKTLVYGNNNMVLVQGEKEVLKEEIEIIDIYTSKNKILILGPEELNIYEVISK